MPLVRYFLYVGGALLGLLLVANAALQGSPAAEPTQTAAADFPPIRIHTDRKWPARVVFDTSAPVTRARVELLDPQPRAAALPRPPVVASEFTAKARVREAFAQFRPEPEYSASDVKLPEPKMLPKRKVAKRQAPPPRIQLAQQPQAGLFANRIW